MISQAIYLYFRLTMWIWKKKWRVLKIIWEQIISWYFGNAMSKHIRNMDMIYVAEMLKGPWQKRGFLLLSHNCIYLLIYLLQFYLKDLKIQGSHSTKKRLYITSGQSRHIREIAQAVCSTTKTLNYLSASINVSTEQCSFYSGSSVHKNLFH